MAALGLQASEYIVAVHAALVDLEHSHICICVHIVDYYFDELKMSLIRVKWPQINEPSVIFTTSLYQSQPRHQIFASFVREWQGNGNVGKTFSLFISTFVTSASPFVSIYNYHNICKAVAAFT